MKNKFKKILLASAVIMLISAPFCFSASALTEGKYSYHIENGVAILDSVDESISGKDKFRQSLEVTLLN